MSIRKRLVIGSLSFVASMALASAATAACTGSSCDLGGQLRAQIGNGLPIPITLAPAPGTANAPADLRWGQPGGIKATGSAMVVQQDPASGPNPSTAPRSLMFTQPSLFTYNQASSVGEVGIGVIKFNAKVMSVKTNLRLSNPHPGTTTGGITTPNGPFVTRTLAAGGRSGGPVVTWCVGMPFATASANPGCDFPFSYGTTIPVSTNGKTSATAPPVNGLIRYTATANQIGGTGGGRTLGTAMVYFNGGGLAVNQLPCVWAPVLNSAANPKQNPNCFVGISQVTPGTGGVNGGGFGGKVTNSAYTTPTGYFTANLGANGTVHSHGTPNAGVILTPGSNIPLPFTGQAATSWGFPGTTGKLTISVTKNEDAPAKLEIFKRTGGDNRTAGGQGIVVTVSGAVSSRNISGPNGNRGWATYNVPEPSAIFAASAGLFALFGCHQLVRRRNR
jgi:hypothetical protein